LFESHRLIAPKTALESQSGIKAKDAFRIRRKG